MARVRCITEMGMGVDVHGRDATKAGKRAVSDAIRHSSLGFVRMLGKTPHDMFVDVTIAVPNPESVDKAAIAKELPYATQFGGRTEWSGSMQLKHLRTFVAVAGTLNLTRAAERLYLAQSSISEQ